MDKIIKCTKFQLNQFKGSAIKFPLITYMIYIFVTILIKFTSNTNTTISFGFFMAAVIFSFVYFTASYAITFNNLVIFSNTRKNILASFFLTSVLIALFLTLISFITDYIQILISKLLCLSSLDVVSEFYHLNGIANLQKLAFYFGLMFVFSSVALLYGCLSYKFGKVFRLVFWCLFGSSFIYVPLTIKCIPQDMLVKIADFFKFYFGAYQSGIITASVNFIITGIILSIITYLIAKRQPQNV